MAQQPLPSPHLLRDIAEATPALTRSVREVTGDLRRASAALHVMYYPVKAEETYYILAKCRAARASLEAFEASLLFAADPEAPLADEPDSPV